MESWDIITLGTYIWQSGTSPMSTYSVGTVNYDANGNIRRLYRKSFSRSSMDDMKYNYLPNNNWTSHLERDALTGLCYAKIQKDHLKRDGLLKSGRQDSNTACHGTSPAVLPL